MNTEDLINILTYYHLQEFTPGTELVQALLEDDYLAFDSRRYTTIANPCLLRDTAVRSKWRSAYKIRGLN